MADAVVVIGIGGSYLGAKALIRAVGPYFPSGDPGLENEGKEKNPEIIFAGHQLSGRYLSELLAHLEGRSVFVIVISKSGTTLEPAIAFRVIRQWMQSVFEDADARTIVITDASSGALASLASRKSLERFSIRNDIGGRFSVLTPVGLLPAACAGVDVRSVFYGAVAQCQLISSDPENDSLAYALYRHLLLSAGFETEVLAFFEPRMDDFAAWFIQLFGESEGKNHTGVFPAAAAYTTDLHSLGQYMQEGRRSLFETFLIADSRGGAVIPSDAENLDGLNYLAGRSIDQVNMKAYEGTARAHSAGGVPNMTLRMDSISEENLGRLIYFFEHAVAVGGYLLGVNPFDQPGVEAYKQEMFAALGKPK